MTTGKRSVLKRAWYSDNIMNVEMKDENSLNGNILNNLSTIKLERQFFRTGRRIAPKFCTCVRI